MARQRTRGELLSTSVTLPEDLKGRLQTAADGNGVKLASEIRDRLENSFAAAGAVTVAGGKTAQLLELVVQMAGYIEGTTGRPWHETQEGTQIFGSAVQAVIGFLAKGQKGKVDPDLFGLVYGEPPDLAAGGRMVAGLYLKDIQSKASKE